MALTETSVLDSLDAASDDDWPDFRGVSSLEYHAMRLVVLCERGSDDWGLVFDMVRGCFLDPHEFAAVGVVSKRYGPSIPSHAINVPAKRHVALSTTPHAKNDLSLDGVKVGGPAGELVFEPRLIREDDLRPGKVCNDDQLSERPADMLLVRAYLAKHPGSLFPSLSESAALLGGTEADVLFVTDAFEHVLGRSSPEGDPEIDRFVIRPSESETYRSLARAIVARDPSLFVPGASNLDWRRWARFDDERART